MSETRKAIEKFRERQALAKKTLLPKARLEEYQKIANEVRIYLQHFEEKQAAEAKAFDDAAAQLKPKESVTREGYFTKMLRFEKEKNKYDAEKEFDSQNLSDSKNVAVLNYLSKIVLSRIAAEADTPERYLTIIKELANHEDSQIRQVFTDSYHDIILAGREIDGFHKSEVEKSVREQYKTAKESLKSSEQLKYEAALQEASDNKLGLFTKYLGPTTAVTDYLNGLQADIVFLNSDVELEEKDRWNTTTY